MGMIRAEFVYVLFAKGKFVTFHGTKIRQGIRVSPIKRNLSKIINKSVSSFVQVKSYRHFEVNSHRLFGQSFVGTIKF